MPADTPSSVLLAGGGTAGHVSPLLALADCLRRRDPAVTVTALGTATGSRGPAGPRARLPAADRAQGAAAAQAVRLTCCACPGNLRAAVAAAERAIDESGAQVVVGFGGYVSTPAYLAARRRHVPDRRARAERPSGPRQPRSAPG